MEERIDSATVFDGRIVSVRVDQVKLPGGRHSTREVVEHPGAVAIVPITTSGNVLLVEQYRYAVNRTLLEVPAGTREADESPLETARRELEEETGYRAESLVEIGRFFVSPGWATEEIVLFRAETLEPTGHGFDHDEILDILEIEPARVPVLMRDGRIADAKTIVGLQLAITNVQQPYYLVRIALTSRTYAPSSTSVPAGTRRAGPVPLTIMRHRRTYSLPLSS